MIVPTRRRPQNIPPLVEAFDATTTWPQTHVEVVIDGDPDAVEYERALARWIGTPSTFDLWNFSLRRGMCATLNHVSQMGHSLGRSPGNPPTIIGFMGDDHRPRTVGWDRRIIEAMPPLGVVYTDDGFQGENLPTSVFMDAELVRRLGWMVPPGIGHLFCDNAWKALGEALGTLVYLPDVLIEHMHPHAGKAEMDAGYAEVNSARQWEADEQAFRAWLAGGLPADVARVRGQA